MIYAYTCTLTGSPDILLPAKSFNYRQKQAAQSTMRVVVPGLDYSDAISARSAGELIIELFGNGNSLAEIGRANLTQIVPHYGAASISINLSGTKQQTYTPAATPHDLTGLCSYCAPNQSNGLYTFHVHGPQYQIVAGDTVTLDSVDYTIETVTWRFDGARTVMYLGEGSI